MPNTTIDACWPTVFVSDLDVAFRFYRDVVGFREVRRMGINIQLSGHGVTLLLRHRPGEAPYEPTKVNLGFMVRDLTKAMSELSAKGVMFVGDIVETPLAKVVFFNDPEGTSLYVCQWL